MKKKGQGLSLNLIIIAAIALIVLVIIVLIFTGRMKAFTGQVDDCSGTCVATAADCSGDYQKVTNDGCPDNDGDGVPDGVCCISVT